jgi:hypothetical protein
MSSGAFVHPCSARIPHFPAESMPPESLQPDVSARASYHRRLKPNKKRNKLDSYKTTVISGDLSRFRSFAVHKTGMPPAVCTSPFFSHILPEKKVPLFSHHTK